MIIVEAVSDLRRETARLRQQGRRIAFVPTMGNLHAGHLKLVQIAREYAGAVVASIYVNPLQFGPKEDFAAYPRTPDEDKQARITQLRNEWQALHTQVIKAGGRGNFLQMQRILQRT